MLQFFINLLHIQVQRINLILIVRITLPIRLFLYFILGNIDIYAGNRSSTQLTLLVLNIIISVFYILHIVIILPIFLILRTSYKWNAFRASTKYFGLSQHFSIVANKLSLHRWHHNQNWKKYLTIQINR